jgi:hypothetical protein
VKNSAEPQADQQTTANAIRTLQEAVQQLSLKVDNSTRALQQKPSYAAVTRKATSPFAAKVIEKLVLGQHKREIIVIGIEHADIRTHRELTEQLNNTRKRGQVVAVQGLPSGDLILATDDEPRFRLGLPVLCLDRPPPTRARATRSGRENRSS